MAEIVVCSAAESDYTEAISWYAQHSLQAAEGFETEVERALQAIAADPHRYRHCDERHRFYLMRRYPYQIIYRELPDHIAVIAIAHMKRDPSFWAKR